MPTPEPSTPADEIRRLMQADWGDITQGAAPLADTERAARLYGIVADPYHRLAFAGRSNIELMTICAAGLLEDREWDKAARLIFRIDRMERQQQRDLAQALAHHPRVQPADAPPEAPPPASSDPAPSRRELWLQLKAARRDQQRARAGKQPFPKPAATDASTPAPNTTTAAARQPFT